MNPPRVLVVDDNPINIELARHVLENDGFVVSSAASATAAASALPGCRPDLILLDIQMPETDGLALARRLKLDRTTSPIVIVAFTAYAMKGDEAKMRAAGCDGYIAKPIDVTLFAAQVRALLKK